jgi:protein TonB
MTTAALATEDCKRWGVAGGLALVAHIGLAVLAIVVVRPHQPPTPEPVVLVDLLPEAAPAPAAQTEAHQAEPQPRYVPTPQLTPRIEIPPVKAPLPHDPVTLPPPPPPLPARRIESAAPKPASAAAPAPLSVAAKGTGTGTSVTPGNDPKAKQREADYFALVSAHLNRRKQYPREAKQARQQGVVTVRFTVDRGGNVSATSIKRSSGHTLLDQATLDLLIRVSPLPRMPSSMQRDSVTIAVPIEYSLKTD